MKAPTLQLDVYKSKDGWRVRVTHRNGNILLVSGEAYKRKFDANRMLTRLLLAVQSGDFKRT